MTRGGGAWLQDEEFHSRPDSGSSYTFALPTKLDVVECPKQTPAHWPKKEGYLSGKSLQLSLKS